MKAVGRCKMKRHLCTSILLFLAILSGCGYSFHGRANLPFESVAVEKIINRTFEPKLEDRLDRALGQELMKQGFRIQNDSPYRIVGNITAFELRTLSEKAGVTVEYEIIIRGDFRLLGPSGMSKELRNRGAFFVSFGGTGALQDVMALKEVATERALRDLSSEIVASLIFP